MIVAISAGRAAPASLRERLSLDDHGVREAVRRRAGVDELFVLSTCHRTEVYVVCDGALTDAVHAAAAVLPGLQPGDQAQLAVMRDGDAVRHLYRVTCGLDSLVIGEPQILTQVRQAYAIAQEEGAIGRTLSHVCSRAIALGRQVRRSTPLGARAASIGSVTAAMIAERVGHLPDLAGAVIGSGDAARDAASALHSQGARLVVVGRTGERARRLAATVGGGAYGIDDLTDVLAVSDYAVVAVGGGTLVRDQHVGTRDGRPLLLVDLSVPRAVDVQAMAGVDVFSIEDLPASGNDLRSAAVDAEQAVEVAVDEWVRRTTVTGQDVGQLRMHAQQIVTQEVARTLARMNLDQPDAERVAAMAQRIANKLLHGPTVAMRGPDEEMRAAVLRMFDLEP